MEKTKNYLFELESTDTAEGCFKLNSDKAVIESAEINLIKDPITNTATGSNLRLTLVIPCEGNQDVIEHFLTD